MNYSHLTIIECEDVRVMLEDGRNQRHIARQLNRAPSTINCELKRNNVSTESYRAHSAQARYETVRQSYRPSRKALNPNIQKMLAQRF